MATERDDGVLEGTEAPLFSPQVELESLRSMLSEKENQLMDIKLRLTLANESLEELRSHRNGVDNVIQPPLTWENGGQGSQGQPSTRMYNPHVPKLKMPTFSLPTFDGTRGT